VGTFPVDGGLKQYRLGFSILTKVDNQQGMVLYIERTAHTDYLDISAQKYVVLECLRAHQNIGYNIPTYSSMKIGALDVGLHHDIGHYCAQFVENNINDVVSHITYIQINCYVYIYA